MSLGLDRDELVAAIGVGDAAAASQHELVLMPRAGDDGLILFEVRLLRGSRCVREHCPARERRIHVGAGVA